MKRVVISEFMDAPAVTQLAARHTVVYDPKLVDDPQRLIAESAQCDALIVRNRTQVRGVLLDALRTGGRCRTIGRLGVGLDNIDVPGCAAAGIEVIPATGANALSVAEYVVTTAMLLLRGAYLSSAAVAAGNWPRPRLGEGREAAGKTLGLVGFGSIGQATAKLARAIGMQVLAYDPQVPGTDPAWSQIGVSRFDLDLMVQHADVISLHVPLNDQTRDLFSASRIAQMKQGAVLINTARGGIVDEAALAAGLRRGHIGGAALDVFQDEPLPATRLWVDCPNVVLTPHVAGVTIESNERVSALIARRVADALGA
jgi:(S)-sulfolactate dehydrogenase